MGVLDAKICACPSFRYFFRPVKLAIIHELSACSNGVGQNSFDLDLFNNLNYNKCISQNTIKGALRVRDDSTTLTSKCWQM
jgi:hypothetical protein